MSDNLHSWNWFKIPGLHSAIR